MNNVPKSFAKLAEEWREEADSPRIILHPDCKAALRDCATELEGCIAEWQYCTESFNRAAPAEGVPIGETISLHRDILGAKESK